MYQIKIVMGHVGQDPQVKVFEGGGKVATFPVATNFNYKNKAGEKVTETEWHTCKVYGKLVAVVENYVKKGTLVHVTGRDRTRSWDDSQGAKQYKTELIVNDLTLGPRGASNDGGGQNASSRQSNNQNRQYAGNPSGNIPQPLGDNPDDDDLPF